MQMTNRLVTYRILEQNTYVKMTIMFVMSRPDSL